MVLSGGSCAPNCPWHLESIPMDWNSNRGLMKALSKSRAIEAIECWWESFIPSIITYNGKYLWSWNANSQRKKLGSRLTFLMILISSSSLWKNLLWIPYMLWNWKHPHYHQSIDWKLPHLCKEEACFNQFLEFDPQNQYSYNPRFK